MNKYIGENRLTYLWGKIKAFVSNAISGKVDKVSSSTDNAIVRFDGTSGNIQNSGVTINDSNHLTAAKLITSGGTSSQFVKGDGSLDNNTYAGAQTSGGAANKAVSIPFGQVDSTSTSTAFTATVDGITELRDGVCVYLKNGVVTSAASCTLNVNELGAKPMYNTMAATTAVSTQWNVNYTMLFIYNSTRVSGGCWDMYYGYDANTDTIGYQLRTNSYTLPVSDTSRYYKIFFTSADNTKYVPASADSTNSATSAKPVNQRPINPFGAIVYLHSTSNFTTGTNVTATAIWQQYNVTLGYSFNRTGAALTLTTSKPVFIKCAPQNDGSAIIDANTPYVQDLPTTEDGKIYIFLGVAYSATQVELQMVHPVYYYKNGSINLWTGTGTQTDVSKSTESNVIDVGGYDLMKINEVKGKSLVMNQLVKNGNFADATGWSLNASNYGTITTNNNTATVTLTQVPSNRYTPALRRNDVNIVQNHYYLCKAEVYSTISTSWRMEIGGSGWGTASDNLDANKWNRFAFILKRRDTPSSALFPIYPNYNIDDWQVGNTWSVRNVQCIDLTQMFGAGNEPTTVEEVEAILGNDYYEYNTGEVVGNSVEKLDVTGFNIWNGEYTEEDGRYIAGDGAITASTNYRVSSYIPVLPNTQYYLKDVVGSSASAPAVCWYDSEKNFISGLNGASKIYNKVVTSPANATYLRCSIFKETADTACINKSNTSKNGTYEPYKHSEFPLNLTELTGKVNGEGTSVTIFPDGLHGVGTAYDSLIVDEDGYARRAVKRMAKGLFTDLTWAVSSITISGVTYQVFRSGVLNDAKKLAEGICDIYEVINNPSDLDKDKTLVLNSSYWSSNPLRCAVTDESCTTLEDFNSKIANKYFYYELATPIEYVLDTPVQCVAKVYPNGTVKQVPVMPDSTPIVMDVTYLRDTGGFIGGMMNKLASLEARIAALEGG